MKLPQPQAVITISFLFFLLFQRKENDDCDEGSFSFIFSFSLLLLVGSSIIFRIMPTRKEREKKMKRKISFNLDSYFLKKIKLGIEGDLTSYLYDVLP